MDFRQWAMLTMLRTYNLEDAQGAVSRGGLFGLYSVTQDGDVGTTVSVAMFNGGDGDTFNGPQTFFLPLRGGYPGNPVYNLKNRYQNSSWNPHANDPAVQNRYRWQMYVDDGTAEIVGPNYSPVTGTPWSEENFEACTYAARETCARFCLYYVNSYGGWDWLLILGLAVESDSVEDTQIERRSPSALATGNVRQRGVEVIRATVTKHLELHTHWLTDSQAARMHNLLNSPDVWVHDLERDLIFPAVLTKPGCEFKTYKNQGHKLVSYQIDVDYAVTCERV